MDKENDEIDIDEKVKHALSKLNEVEEGAVFVVRDLWEGHLWKRIPIADRLLIGRLFHIAVKQLNPSLVDILEKTKDRQQKYRKK